MVSWALQRLVKKQWADQNGPLDSEFLTTDHRIVSVCQFFFQGVARTRVVCELSEEGKHFFPTLGAKNMPKAVDSDLYTVGASTISEILVPYSQSSYIETPRINFQNGIGDPFALCIRTLTATSFCEPKPQALFDSGSSIQTGLERDQRQEIH